MVKKFTAFESSKFEIYLGYPQIYKAHIHDECSLKIQDFQI